jgi:beta-N-acetylhexosaminidase
MISHVGLPKIRGDQRPASLSAEVITDIVRTEWEYDGIVITDFMNRSCMYQKYTYAEAAVGVIEAGADMILSPKFWVFCASRDDCNCIWNLTELFADIYKWLGTGFII